MNSRVKAKKMLPDVSTVLSSIPPTFLLTVLICRPRPWSLSSTVFKIR